MLLFQDASGEGVLVVGVEDRAGFLHDDGAVVELFVDEVDGAARDFHAVGKGLLLGFEAGEGGQ